jgi:hypothetical protein
MTMKNYSQARLARVLQVPKINYLSENLAQKEMDLIVPISLKSKVLKLLHIITNLCLMKNTKKI